MTWLLHLLKHTNYLIYFASLACSHSLGSALAMVTAAKLEADGYSVAAVYSFGGPRSGDGTWAGAYNALGLNDKTLRFVYYKDPVPLLPPLGTDYKHVGRMVQMPLGECQQPSLRMHGHAAIQSVYNANSDARVYRACSGKQLQGAWGGAI
jgi:hypothetical protein